MSWKDLLSKDETITVPWLGGRTISRGNRWWTVQGKLPREPGWYGFKVLNRTATLEGAAEPDYDCLRHTFTGYLVGDRFIDEYRTGIHPDPNRIIEVSEPVALIEQGLDRFSRVRVGAVILDEPLFYIGQEMPLGPEDAVLRAFQDKLESVAHIKGVVPALDAAFRMEAYQREEARKRREEIERLRREEEERLLKEERRQALFGKLGDAATRREMAKLDFGEAARAALAVGGAEYLDHRKGRNKYEMVVTFRIKFGRHDRRFECVADALTLRIVDAGICLIDHHTEERGDTYFTLESLPGVISEAERLHRLVVFRHVDGDRRDDYHDDYD